MRVLSLFSGGGLGDYGLELAGMKIVGQVEIDKYCQKILQLRWPRVKKWGDIRNVKEKELKECGNIEIISGGFPCQDISIAGQGKGIRGKRSGLWKEFYRIIRTVTPRYCLIENTERLHKKGLNIVLSDLAEIGYDAEWLCLRAEDFGSPHKRERLFLIAYPRSNNSRRIFDGKYEISIHPSWNYTKNIRKWSGWKHWIVQVMADIDNGKNSNLGFRMDDGDTNRVEQIKLLGNGQFVQAVEWIGEQILKHMHSMPWLRPGKLM